MLLLCSILESFRFVAFTFDKDLQVSKICGLSNVGVPGLAAIELLTSKAGRNERQELKLFSRNFRALKKREGLALEIHAAAAAPDNRHHHRMDRLKEGEEEVLDFLMVELTFYQCRKKNTRGSGRTVFFSPFLL